MRFGKRHRPRQPVSPWSLRFNRFGQIGCATEPNGAAPVQPRPHQDDFRGKVRRAWTAIHVPIRSFGLKECASPDDAKPGSAIAAFAFRPLPDIAAHIITAKRRSPGRESFYRRGCTRCPVIAPSDFPMIAPGILATVNSLRGVLPFLFRRQPFTGPTRVRPRIVEVYVDHGMICFIG